MRWPTFLICAWLFTCVQLALVGLLRWGEATPDVVLLLVVFVALHAPPRVALSGAVVAGLMHDVIAGHGLGTYAVGYAMAAAIAGQLRDVMYAEHPSTQFAVTLVGGVAIVIYLELRHLIRSWLFSDDPSLAFWPRVLGALTAAALAVPVVWLLRRVRRAFGFASR